MCPDIAMYVCFASLGTTARAYNKEKMTEREVQGYTWRPIKLRCDLIPIPDSDLICRCLLCPAHRLGFNNA